MKTHAADGRKVIDKLTENLGLGGNGYVYMLNNIAQSHHENLDGSGYPEGLSGTNMPIEARIVTVADVFDSLISECPYKKVWSNERAVETLKEISGWKLDPMCVEALLFNMDEVVDIQAAFVENDMG